MLTVKRDIEIDGMKVERIFDQDVKGRLEVFVGEQEDVLFISIDDYVIGFVEHNHITQKVNWKEV